MHGRVKTRTTEEQEKIKQREKLKKIEVYKESMGKLTEMRKSGLYDGSAIDITSNVLLKNPDILTVWNYRREIFLLKRKEFNDEDYQKLLEGDLSLTEQCLRVNPKSYSSWHHRVWILSNVPKPNWERELYLCRKYLELDERNFHCWDYRSFVVKMASVTDESEYEYTLEKIKANFSNYSAWHLRSKLLPKIFPDAKNKLPVNEAKHKEELELVQNAAFTDPNDQSAWFYQRWLLGLTEPNVYFVNIQAVEDKIAVAVSKNLNQNGICGTFIKVEINNQEVYGIWNPTSYEPQSTVWMLNLKSKVSQSDRITLTLKEEGVQYEKVELSEGKYMQKKPNFIANLSPCLKEVLEDELSTCHQLLELEPDSKWTFLTKLFLMEAIDPVEYEKEIKSGYRKLTEIDPLRSGYYQDLCSKFTIECAIRRYDKSQSRFTLNNENLTCLYHMQYFMLLENLDLSFNCLTSESLSSLHSLINCKRLNLDNNQIKTLKFMPVLPSLMYLSVRSNEIQEPSSEYLKKFKRLKEFLA